MQQLIAVREPYFALKNIKSTDKHVSAFINTEYLNHHETPGMSLAEVGRHLAILGSLAMAESNPKKEKHYYLATNATFERTSEKPYFDTIYKGSMKTVDFNKRKGFTKGELVTDENEVIYSAEVEYTVLNQNIFERMFDDQKQNTSVNNYTNPYNDQVELKNLMIDAENCSA